MESRETIMGACGYFFEVLIKNYLECEKTFQKKSGILSLFKKPDYLERAKAFSYLAELAKDARDSLPEGETIKNDLETYGLASKLTECYAIYINLADTHANINLSLTSSIGYEDNSQGDRTQQIEMVTLYRKSLESELPKLQAHYSEMLKKNSSINEKSSKLEINELDLADLVLKSYSMELEKHFESIKSSIHTMGFEKDDIEESEFMRFDIFLCALSMDTMSIFNLLDADQAERIFKYISKDRFELGEKSPKWDYAKHEISLYRQVWDEANRDMDIPFDHIFSMLFSRILGENIKKYSIDSSHMIHLMSLIIPVFVGKWKNALEKYTPIQENLN